MDTRRTLTPLTLAFATLFVLSGACGLTYEVVWSRHLVHVFGVTAFAVSTVLVSFMGGMAIGAWLFGRRAARMRRPLRVFALLEAGIGLYALALPLLLDVLEWLYRVLFASLADAFLLKSVLRFGLCLGVLLVPTVLMGGTLPALGQGLLRRRDRIGLGVGLLYFVNTLGAAIGCYLAGFELIPTFGLQGATLIAAGGNAFVAAIAWLMDARSAGLPAPLAQETGNASTVRAEPLTTPANWALIVAFGSGLLALAFEIVWFRVLVLVFGSTVYSFSAMLAVFLLGLALGSLALGPLADRTRHPVRLLVITQGCAALFALGGVWLVNRMPYIFLDLLQRIGIDFDGMNTTKLLLSLLTLLPPAIAFGATFPVAVRLAAVGGGETGGHIGRVYAWNTAGAILGSFGTGFLLLPTIGSEWSLRLIVVGALLLSVGSLLAERGPLRLRWAAPAGLVLLAVLGAALAAPRWDRRLLGSGAYFEPRTYIDSRTGRIHLDRVVGDYEVVTFNEGYNETIISYRSSQGKFISVNGSTTASSSFEDMFSQRMLGHLPMALHPSPVRTACIVGLGAGVTAGSIAVYQPPRLVAVELERGVFEASRFFTEENHGVLDRPGVEIRIDDGRSYLQLTDERFDVISSAPNFPSLTGSGALYSKDFFELARSRLAPGGVMTQFVPIWRLEPDQVRTISASFGDVFPHIRVFNAGLSLILLGRETPHPPVDVAEVQRRLAEDEVAASLAEVGIGGAAELLALYQFDGEQLAAFYGDAPRSTRDHPRVEFEAPRSLFSDTVGPNLAELRAVRPELEARASMLGLPGEFVAEWRAKANAYTGAREAEILFHEGDVARAMSMAIGAAEAGQRYAAYTVAEKAEKMGLQLQAQNELQQAAQMFALAIRWEPKRLTSLLGLGYVSIFTGNGETAERALSAAAEFYPRNVTALWRLGFLREIQGRPAEAEQLYRRALAVDPRSWKTHVQLGRLLHDGGRPREAETALEAAFRNGERSLGLMLARGEVALQLDRTGTALDRARQAVKAYPDAAGAHAFLARAADAAGNTDEAAEARGRAERLEGREAGPPAAQERTDGD